MVTAIWTSSPAKKNTKDTGWAYSGTRIRHANISRLESKELITLILR